MAIELFLDRDDYVSSVTLAGAAEEILGKLLEVQGGTPALRELANASVDVGKVLFREAWSVKHFIELMNATRNNLKHINDGNDVPISRDAAVKMLDRAVTNYWTLRNDQTPQMQRFFDEF